jgi:hypothetical protein
VDWRWIGATVADCWFLVIGGSSDLMPLFQGFDEGFLNTLVPLLRHELVCGRSYIWNIWCFAVILVVKWCDLEVI